MDWDDEDEKTTVFDRSGEDSAKALLHGLSHPAATAGAAARAKALGNAPPPAAPSAPAPVPAPRSAAPVPAAPPVISAPAVPAPSAAPAVPFTPPTASAPTQYPGEAGGPGSKKLVIAGGLIAAAVLGGFFFLGGNKTGSIIVTVAGPGGKAVSDLSVKIDGEVKCTSSPCIIEDLPGGKSHVVQVAAPGYAETAGKAVKVIAGEETPFNIDLAPASAGTGIKVTSRTPGLRLKVDGNDVGPLPQELTDLKPGSHTIEVSGNPKFAPFVKKVEVPVDQIIDIEPTLQFLKGEITIELGDNADGAKILLRGDGEDKALHKLKLPLTITIPADKRITLIAEKKGFDRYEQVVDLSADEPEKTYRISLRKPEESSARDTSRPTGSTGSTSTGTSTGSTSTGSTSTTPSPTPSGSAKLNINSIPISNVILDGRPLGSTPKIGVSVSPGSHTVVFVHPQHGRKVQQVNVGAGQTGTATVRFP